MEDNEINIGNLTIYNSDIELENLNVEQVDVEVLGLNMPIIKGEKGDKGDTASDYAVLQNKPKVNSVELNGDKSFEDLGQSVLTNIEIDNIINSIV